MNLTVHSGRQTSEARISTANNGMKIARFTLAVDRLKKDAGADFIGFVGFDKTAEFIEKYGAKGKKWVVTGHIQTGSYEKDGSKVYTTDVIVDRLEFGESKGAESPAFGMPVETNDDEFMEVPDEELPFH